MTDITEWKWVLKQKMEDVQLGDVALVNGVRFVCIEIDENGVATWDDEPYIDITEQKPPPNSTIKVRCLHDGKWVEQVINEKYLCKVKAERLEWMLCNS